MKKFTNQRKRNKTKKGKTIKKSLLVKEKRKIYIKKEKNNGKKYAT